MALNPQHLNHKSGGKITALYAVGHDAKHKRDGRVVHWTPHQPAGRRDLETQVSA